jgi:predicted membrane protein
MNSKELFALFLRIVGVLGIIFIVRHAFWSVPTLTVPTYLLIKWVIGALAGLYLIRGAPLLVKFAFPGKPGSPAQ